MKNSDCSCRTIKSLCCGALLAAIFIPAIGFADAVIRECVLAAKNNKIACTTTCKDTFKNEKVSCGANPECHQSCNAGYEACREEYDLALDSCLDGCQAPYDAAKDACKVSVGCGPGTAIGNCFQNVDFRACLREGILAKVTCSLNCRDQHKTNPTVITALKACAKAANTCHKACRATPTPTPTAVAQ